jgi:hypothetical protein
VSENDITASREARILRVMRFVLTSVIKETATPPGMKHPLSEQTIEDIRQCLALIAARERELSEEEGRPQTDRPYFTDEPSTSATVPVEKIGRPKKN